MREHNTRENTKIKIAEDSNFYVRLMRKNTRKDLKIFERAECGFQDIAFAYF